MVGLIDRANLLSKSIWHLVSAYFQAKMKPKKPSDMPGAQMDGGGFSMFCLWSVNLHIVLADKCILYSKLYLDFIILSQTWFLGPPALHVLFPSSYKPG